MFQNWSTKDKIETSNRTFQSVRDEIENTFLKIEWRGGENGRENLNSKNTRDPERVHWGKTPFRVNDDPEISQPDAEYDPELGQSDPIICQVCGKLTDFRVFLDPEWSLAPMDPFRVKFNPGVFRVYTPKLFLCYTIFVFFALG